MMLLYIWQTLSVSPYGLPPLPKGEAGHALPLGELSPQVTERVYQHNIVLKKVYADTPRGC